MKMAYAEGFEQSSEFMPQSFALMTKEMAQRYHYADLSLSETYAIAKVG